MTNEASFLAHLATFQLTASDRWEEIPPANLSSFLLIQ